MNHRRTKDALREVAERRKKEFGRALIRTWPLEFEGMERLTARAKSVSALEDAVRGFIVEAMELSSNSSGVAVTHALVDDEVARLLSALEERLVERDFCDSHGLASPNELASEFQAIRARLAVRITASFSAHQSAPKPAINKGGRPGKWNWEGALIHLIAIANTTDGLPDDEGPQARIGEIMADWFATNSEDGSTPAESEIKKRARLIVEELRG
jgi:hypothetical protein